MRPSQVFYDPGVNNKNYYGSNHYLKDQDNLLCECIGSKINDIKLLYFINYKFRLFIHKTCRKFVTKHLRMVPFCSALKDT